MVQGLARPAVVVVISKPVNPALKVLEHGGLLHVEEPQQGLLRELVLALRGGFAGQSADRHGPFGGEEDFTGTDPAGPQLIERQ